MGRFGSNCEEEGQDPSTVHWLQTIGQGYDQESVPICDAPKPGGPLTTHQPAEIYMSHVMRHVHVQKWPLGPTHPTHKNVYFIQNLFIYNCIKLQFIQNWVLCPEFYKIQERAILAVSSPLKSWMRPIPKCVFDT